MNSNNHITIQGWMITDLHLKGNDLMVYAIIHQFSQDGETKFTGSLQYLADWCSATKQGIMKNLKNLLDKGLIIKEDTVINGVKFVAYYTTELHTIQLSCTKDTNISNITNNQFNLLTDNNTSNNKEDTYNKDVEQFVEDFNEICKSLPKCKLLTVKRKQAIIKLLKKYPYDDILLAFDKLEDSDFCTGRKGEWRANIDFVLREDKFVSILEGKYDNAGRKNNVETISRGDKYKVSAEEKERMRRAVERGELEEY